MSQCSIVIPVHNRAEITRRCIDFLLDQDLDGAEIVVVDDGSSDETPDMLAQLGDRVRAVMRPEAGGFARACNEGVAASSSELVVLLNNDTAPAEGWLASLVEYADAHPRAAVVGARLLLPTGEVQHAGVVFDHNRDIRHLYFGLPGDHPAARRSRRMQVVTAACALIRREAFDQLGGFDTAYVNGYEDMDFCLRAADEGWEVHYCGEAVVRHLESATRGHHEDDANRRLFRERWAERIRPDDMEHYLEDGLISVEYEWHRVRLGISPELGTAITDEENSGLERVLAVREWQAFMLRRENARLAGRTGVDPWAVRTSLSRPLAPDELPARPARLPRATLSIVVALDAGSRGEQTLAALESQSLEAERFEVIPVAPEEGEAGGRAAAWNRGIRAAAADIVLLLADGLVPGPGFAAAHLELHEADPRVQLAGLGGARGEEPPPPDFFWARNVSLNRSFLLADELFDERLSESWEERELGLRLFARGLQVAFLPNAWAEYVRSPAPREQEAAALEAGRSAARFDHKYPHPHPWHSGPPARRRRGRLDRAFARGYREETRSFG